MSTPVYKTIVEQSRDSIFVAQNGTIVYANPQFYQLTGYEQDEDDSADGVIGVAKTNFIAPGDRDRVAEYHAARRTGDAAPDTYEVDLLTKAGGRVPVELSIEDAEYDGQTASYVICRDISDRKTEQQELEQSQRRLRILFDKMPGAIIIHDQHGAVIDVNNETADNLGYSRDELLEMNVSEFEVGVPIDELHAYWDSMSVGETVKADTEHERKDGTRYPVEVWSTKIEVDGEPRYLALARDISERIEEKQELQTLKERLELAVGGAGVGVWDLNMQTDAVEFNEQWANMLGHSPQEIDPHLDAWKERAHPEDIDTVLDALEGHTRGETEYYDTEHRMQTADGEWKWIRTLGKIVDRDDDGEPLRAVGLHLDINKQKQRQQEIKQLRNRLETFSQTVNDAFFFLPRDLSKTLYVNDAIERIYGVAPQEAYADPEVWLRHIHPDDRELLRDTMEDFQNGRVSGMVSQRFRVQHPERGLRWMKTEMDVVTDDSGTVTHIAGITRDVTERKQREMELTQFQEAVDQTADAVYIVDVNGDIEYANAAFEELKTTTGTNAFGRVSKILNAEPTDDPKAAEFWKTVRSGDQWECEITEQRTDGGSITISQVVSPIRDANGEPQKFVGIARDITERKEYEIQLKTAREDLREIIDLVPDIIAVKNKDGRYLLANQTTAEAYGTTVNEIEGTLGKDLLPSPEDAEKFRQDDLDVIESGEPKQIPEEELTTADGDIRTLRTTKLPYEPNGQNTDAVLLYARDITALKQYEQQLETQRDNLNLLNQVVRHDIRNDLQLIQAYAGMLAEANSLSETHQQYLSKVLKATNNAIDLTTSARDLSEVMLQNDAETKPIPLAQALEQQVDRIRSETQTAAITIEGSLPAVDVMADELLEAVFRNLLSNAVQHNDKELPEIVVSATRHEQQVVVKVADNGRGVSDKYKKEIFAHGDQGLGSEGTGIGLHLVKTLVDRYGGTVWVEDNDPEGSIFCVELQTSG